MDAVRLQDPGPGRGSPPARWRPRVALYSHDTVGLGHLRRNLAIAGVLAGRPLLLITGVPEARAFALPEGCDCVVLPGLGKSDDGLYAPRRLAVNLDELVGLRLVILQAALLEFDPDVLVVDKVARGALDELEPALVALRQRGRARMVLGLRDVLDEPGVTCREWQQQRATEAVLAYYDAVWIYGDRRVFDPIKAYRLPRSVADRVTYLGYLAPPAPRPPPPAVQRANPYVLCIVGGGQDGYGLAAAFLHAARPAPLAAVVITGPQMPAGHAQALRRLARSRPRARVLRFVPDALPLIRQAEGVVCMGGYNTLCEVLAGGQRPLVVPRVRPRREQWIRAQRLHELELVDILHPDDLCPARLTDWLVRPRTVSGTTARIDIELDGLQRVPVLLDELLRTPPAGRYRHAG